MIGIIIVALLTCWLAATLLSTVGGSGGRRRLKARIAQQRLRDIKRQTIRELYDAEARHREQHGEVIDSTAAELPE